MFLVLVFWKLANVWFPVFLIRRVGTVADDSDTSWSITALERNTNFLLKWTVLEVKVVLSSLPAVIFTWLAAGNPIVVSTSFRWYILLPIATSLANVAIPALPRWILLPTLIKSSISAFGEDRFPLESIVLLPVIFWLPDNVSVAEPLL